MSRNALLDFEVLLQKYKFKRIDPDYPRTKHIPCPYEHISGEECVCEDGMLLLRVPWVNAQTAWLAEIEDVALRWLNTIVLAQFYSVFSSTFSWAASPFWFSCTLLRGLKGPLINEKLDFAVPISAYASSSYWDGEFAGSGILRYPPDLRGFMYRTDVDGHDGHILPPDIVEYLLEHS